MLARTEALGFGPSEVPWGAIGERIMYGVLSSLFCLLIVPLEDVARISATNSCDAIHIKVA